LIEPTAADWEADKLALDQELIELQQQHEQSLEHLQNQFSDKKAHLAKRRDQLDEQLVAILDFN